MTRFTKLNAQAEPMPQDCTDHVAVLDTTTGLIWSRAPVTTERVAFAKAEAAAKDCRLLGADDWALPTVEQLFLLADRSRYDPAIDTDVFPDTPSDWFWSSSPYAYLPGYAWVVGFSTGNPHFGHRRSGYAFARAVRRASIARAQVAP